MIRTEIDELAQEAAAMVADVAEEYRRQAFQVVFARLLEGGGIKGPAAGRRDRRVPQRLDTENRDEMLGMILAADMDYSRYDQILRGGAWVDRAMAVLRVVREEFGVAALTPPELAAIMTEQLRLPSVYATNLSNALREERRYFIRSQEGRGYKYALTRSADEYLDRLVVGQETNG